MAFTVQGNNMVGFQGATKLVRLVAKMVQEKINSDVHDQVLQSFSSFFVKKWILLLNLEFFISFTDKIILNDLCLSINEILLTAFSYW